MATRIGLGTEWKEKNRIKWLKYFSLHCILYSKIETGLSNKDDGDVAINAYLEKLLSLFTNPRGFDLKMVEKQFGEGEYDSMAFRQLERVNRGKIKYQIYRTKTEFLLLSFTMIDNYILDKYFFREKASIGMEGDYCFFRHTFCHTVSKGDFLITDILEKLLFALEKYSKIISHFRGEYRKGQPDLFQRLLRGKFYHLERVVDEAGRREALKEKYDQLLELISRRKKRKSSQVKREIQALIEEIKGLNPEFSFSLPEK